MSRNIWIINEYAGSPYHGMEFRSYYIAKELVKLGDSVTIISSSYSHVFNTQPTRRRENLDGVNFLWLKMFNYGKSHDKRRVIKWFYFMLKVFFLPFMLKKKPDVIIVSPMAPFPILPGWFLSKLYGAKLIYEVKDIWPLSIIELGGFSPRHPLIQLMQWCEKFAITKSDIIVSNLQNYGEHIKNDLHLKRDFEWISNGVDLEELMQIQPLNENTKKQIPKDKFIVGYTGTVGVANALESLCEAAVLLQKYDDILIVIVGNGQNRDALIQKYAKNQNILFIDAIAKKEVQSMLQLFDICYIGLQRERLFRYGVSPNKLFDYMYAAKPVLYAIDSGKANIVKTADCGVSVEAQNPQAIAHGIESLYNFSQEQRDFLGQNGKSYILKHFTYDKLAKEYQNLIQRER